MNDVQDSESIASRSLTPPRPATLIDELSRDGHHVQFFEEDQFLVETVVEYLRAGFDAGDRLLIVATESHRTRIVEGLGANRVSDAVDRGRMLVLDAAETLSRIMVGDMPDAERFNRILSDFLVQLGGDGELPRIRAFGEMVNLLWRRGNAKAAIRLEELWNDARKAHPFALLCAYAVATPFASSDVQHFARVCDEHELALPTERFFARPDVTSALREVCVAQHLAHALDAEVSRRRELERAVEDAMQALGRVEQELAQSTQREHAERKRAEASDAFEELFLGILENDLQKPLGTILSSVEKMGVHDDPFREGLNQVRASALHIERMVAQLADVTRIRARGGIQLSPVDGQDIVPIVAKVVFEAGGAAPEHSIVLRGSRSCPLRVDPERFEEVVSNVVGNAVVHGDPAWPINVTVAELGAEVSISVQNCGPPIPSEMMPILFSPFARGARPRRGPVGLGLGLYISELIVTALGGRIEVESNEGGTLFEIVLPR